MRYVGGFFVTSCFSILFLFFGSTSSAIEAGIQTSTESAKRSTLLQLRLFLLRYSGWSVLTCRCCETVTGSELAVNYRKSRSHSSISVFDPHRIFLRYHRPYFPASAVSH